MGSTEQHGPHLPLSTDTLIAEELAGRAVHRTDGLMVGPTLSVTASGEHGAFPGTLSIGSDATTLVLVELVRSADWCAGVVLVNGHGGNHAAVRSAVGTLEAEGRRVLAWSPKWPRRRDGGPADLHAGRLETSMMLAIDPGLVRLELAEAGRRCLDRRPARTRGARASARTACSATPTVPQGVKANGSSPNSSRISSTRSNAGGRSTSPTEREMAFQVDGSWSRYGALILAGSPLRVFRITTAGTTVAERLERGDHVGSSHLVDRLLDAGAIHPIADAADGPHTTAPRFGVDDVTVVTPRFRSAASATSTDGRIADDRITVDDGSDPPIAGATVRLDTNRGPAAARNAARPLITTPLVGLRRRRRDRAAHSRRGPLVPLVAVALRRPRGRPRRPAGDRRTGLAARPRRRSGANYAPAHGSATYRAPPSSCASRPSTRSAGSTRGCASARTSTSSGDWTPQDGDVDSTRRSRSGTHRGRRGAGGCANTPPTARLPHRSPCAIRARSHRSTATDGPPPHGSPGSPGIS